MKIIQYQIKDKSHCKACNFSGIPFIKMITFRTSEDFVCAAYCPRCDRYIENVRKQDVIIRNVKGMKNDIEKMKK